MVKDMWFLLDTNRKSYIGTVAALLDLTLTNFEMCLSFRFAALYLVVELSHILQLNTMRKSYMGSSAALLHFRLSYFERS